MGSRPGGGLGARPLQFIWITDCSGSMKGPKIQALNAAIRESLPKMCEVAEDNVQAQVVVRALRFSNGATWHIPPTDLRDFRWADLDADGVTDMGKALEMVADVLKMENMPERGLPPVLVLVSDGQPTDDFSKGLKAVMDQPWGMKAVRIAVAIGEDADLDVLQKFIGHLEIKPLIARNAPDLANKIRWASTNMLKAASAPTSRTKDQSNSTSHVQIPSYPADIVISSADQVF